MENNILLKIKGKLIFLMKRYEMRNILPKPYIDLYLFRFDKPMAWEFKFLHVYWKIIG